MPQLSPCPSCSSHLIARTPTCPHCGATLEARTGPALAAPLGAAAVLGLALGACIAQPAYGVPDTGEEEFTDSESESESETGETGETGEEQDSGTDSGN